MIGYQDYEDDFCYEFRAKECVECVEDYPAAAVYGV